tara:strand:+ start:366 stop:1091 length:726 start_codon:yes stop_codon:yes gene_type:complete
MIKIKKPKIVFLVSEDKYYIYDFISKISNLPSVNIKLIVIQKYKETFKRKIILSFLFGFLNCLNLFYQLVFKRSSISITGFCKDNNINYIVTDDLNDPKITHNIQNQKADLIINLNVMKLIKKNFLKKFQKILINFHPGILPKYRGLYSTFYKIINKEKYFGISSHLMREKIDNGPIIAIIKKKINGMNLFDCYKIIYGEMLYKLFIQTLNNHKNRLINNSFNSKIYKTPTFLEILKYKIL